MAKTNLLKLVTESVKPHPLMRKKWFWIASLALAGASQIAYNVQREEIDQLYKVNSGEASINTYDQLKYLNSQGIFPESYMIRLENEFYPKIR